MSTTQIPICHQNGNLLNRFIEAFEDQRNSAHSLDFTAYGVFKRFCPGNDIHHSETVSIESHLFPITLKKVIKKEFSSGEKQWTLVYVEHKYGLESEVKKTFANIRPKEKSTLKKTSEIDISSFLACTATTFSPPTPSKSSKRKVALPGKTAFFVKRRSPDSDLVLKPDSSECAISSISASRSRDWHASLIITFNKEHRDKMFAFLRSKLPSIENIFKTPTDQIELQCSPTSPEFFDGIKKHTVVTIATVVSVLFNEYRVSESNLTTLRDILTRGA